MQSSSIVLFTLLAIHTANSRFLDSWLQNMDMAKQHVQSNNSDSSEEVEGSGTMPERHHHNKRETNSSSLDEAANLIMYAMKREALFDEPLTVQNLTSPPSPPSPIRPSIINGVWTFLDSAPQPLLPQ